MRDIVHCIRLAVATVAMAVCSSGWIWAAPAQPTLQAAPQAAAKPAPQAAPHTAPPPAKADPGATHGKASPAKPAPQAAPQTAPPPAKADPGETHGKASPVKPAAQVAPQAAPPAEANSGETHGKASPVKPAAQAAPQAAPPAEANSGEAPGEAPIGKPVAPEAQNAAAPPTEVGHGTASAKMTDERAGKAPAGDPTAKATEAVDLVNRIMAEQALKPARSSVGKSVGETGGPAVRPQKARVAAKVRPRPLLVWDAPRASDGVALVWDYDLVGKPASTGRVLGIRLTWLR